MEKKKKKKNLGDTGNPLLHYWNRHMSFGKFFSYKY